MTSVVFGGKYRPFRRALSPAVGLYSATGVNPNVLQVTLSGLFSTELDILIPRLILASAIYQVFKGDFISIRSPSV